MNFKVKRVLALVLSVLPIIFLVVSMIFSGMIIEHDLIMPIFVIAMVLIILGLVATFVLARCPHCHMPIMPISLITHSKKCPYCDKEYESKVEQA